MMWCLKRPNGKLIAQTVAQSQGDCWSQWYMHAPSRHSRAVDWAGKNERKVAKHFGWSVVRVHVTEVKK